ncbi:MAG: hypothetical protein ACKVUS_04310 [Saprospiraceae bacterium]
MRQALSILFLTLFCFSKTAAQQQWAQGEDPSWVVLENSVTPTFYPAQISISGAQPYVVGVEVASPFLFVNTGLQEYDFLLESPSGRRVMLFSDWGQSLGLFQADEMRVSATRTPSKFV